MRIADRPRRVTSIASHLFTLTFLAVAALLAPQSVRAQEEMPEDLSPLFRQAADDFRPVTERELEAARADVLQSMGALERFVRPATPNGQRWLRYLRWDALRETLQRDVPDFAPLATTYRQLNQDETGLELPQFRRLAEDLRWFSTLLEMYRRPDQQAFYRSQLEELERQLGEYRREPTTPLATEIGVRLGFVAGLGEAPELVAALRREFAQPNAFLTVATSLIAAGTEPIHRREIVHDVILGANIRGDALTIGKVGVASIPSEDKAILEYVSHGQTRSMNVGRSGPAVIYSTSFTDFNATKRVEFSDELFAALPARAHARTNSQIQSTAAARHGLFAHMIARTARRRAEQARPQAEAIAARRAEGRIASRFDNEVRDDLRTARQRYDEEFRRPLARRGELPEHVRFRSDRESVGIEVTQAGVGQLGAATFPPIAPRGHDITARVHESAVNNYSAVLLAGATASETEPDDMRLDVAAPQWMRDIWERPRVVVEEEPAEPFRPWSLRFSHIRPVTVAFRNGEVHITLHIAQLTSGDRVFDEWDVTGIYAPELVEGTIVLRRERDLEMLPADFVGELTPRQVAERRSLEVEMNERAEQGRGLPFTIEFDPLEPEGALAAAGPLDMTDVISENGWLTLTWDRRRGR